MDECEPTPAVLTTVCAWCHRVIELPAHAPEPTLVHAAAGSGQVLPLPERRSERVSHGICPACVASYFPDAA